MVGPDETPTTRRAGHQPVRTCVGCRRQGLRRDLLRVVAESGTRVVPDPTGTARGRGAHLHLSHECLALALRRRAFPRALRVPGGLDTAPVAEWVAEHVPAAPQH